MSGLRGWTSLRIVLAAALALAAVLAAGMESAQAASVVSAMALAGKTTAEADEWWRHAVIYQIYPRSFKDSNGDGIGDIKGITSKLDYLKSIGVTGVWLSPFYPSPQADFGYDISNYKDVDPTYGTLEDFKDMVDTAHSLGMKVVVDLVPNHSSDEHEWFKQSSKDPTGPYGNYYIWHEGNKTNLDPVTGRPAPPSNWVSVFRYSAWTWNEDRQAYYLHQFAVKQPDLNYREPAVVDEIKDVFRFWMNQGVDGFRVDALPYLFEIEDVTQDEPPNPDRAPDLTKDDHEYLLHPYTTDVKDTYDMLRQWREVVDEFGKTDNQTRVIMTECYTNFQNTIRYYGTEDEPGAHFTFNFQLISYSSKSSTAKDIKDLIDQWMEAMDWRWPNWLIGNHDNKRVGTRYPNLEDAMNMVTLTLPGTAMTYNGEEIGMTDAFIRWDETKDPQALNLGPDRYLEASRDPCRTPMQWDNSTSAGFSTNPVTWMPTNPNYWDINVANQNAAARSHLQVYRDLTEARKTPTLRGTGLKTEVVSDDVLVIKRFLEDHDTYVTLVNFGSWEKRVNLAEIGLCDSKVYTSSISSRLTKGQSAASTSSITLRPKEGVVLVAPATPEDVSTTSPAHTTSTAASPRTDASTQPTSTTTQTSAGAASRAAAVLSVLAPLLGLLL